MRFKILAILVILILSALLVQSQRTPQNLQDTVWLLEGDRAALLGSDEFFGQRPHSIIGVVIVPEPVGPEVIGAAWTYAIRYGADGLDLPNWERAIEILMERHPTWKVSLTQGYLISYEQYPASLDTQDPTLTPMPEASETP